MQRTTSRNGNLTVFVSLIDVPSLDATYHKQKNGNLTVFVSLIEVPSLDPSITSRNGNLTVFVSLIDVHSLVSDDCRMINAEITKGSQSKWTKWDLLFKFGASLQ